MTWTSRPALRSQKLSTRPTSLRRTKDEAITWSRPPSRGAGARSRLKQTGRERKSWKLNKLSSNPQLWIRKSWSKICSLKLPSSPSSRRWLHSFTKQSTTRCRSTARRGTPTDFVVDWCCKQVFILTLIIFPQIMICSPIIFHRLFLFLISLPISTVSSRWAPDGASSWSTCCVCSYWWAWCSWWFRLPRAPPTFWKRASSIRQSTLSWPQTWHLGARKKNRSDVSAWSEDCWLQQGERTACGAGIDQGNNRAEQNRVGANALRHRGWLPTRRGRRVDDRQSRDNSQLKPNASYYRFTNVRLRLWLYAKDLIQKWQLVSDEGIWEKWSKCCSNSRSSEKSHLSQLILVKVTFTQNP